MAINTICVLHGNAWGELIKILSLFSIVSAFFPLTWCFTDLHINYFLERLVETQYKGGNSLSVSISMPAGYKIAFIQSELWPTSGLLGGFRHSEGVKCSLSAVGRSFQFSRCYTATCSPFEKRLISRLALTGLPFAFYVNGTDTSVF